MDGRGFDAFTCALGHAPTRRAVVSLLGGLLATPLSGVLDVTARKKKRKKKSFCLDGQTIKASKKKKKTLIKRGATQGACAPLPPACIPACAANICGGDDGCGGVCACAAGFVCQGGICHACTVGCAGGGTACGADLTTALTGAAGGTVFVCPGRYVGSFTVGNGALVGAGDGDDPATSTILDASGNGRVVNIGNGVTAALHGLRITGGDTPVSGGGVANSGTLTMTECTIDKNHAGDDGGGIHSNGPKLTLNACVVSGNTCTQDGGGILTGGAVTINGSAFTGNAAGGFGGGLHCNGAVALDSGSSVTGNTCSANGTCGGGIVRLGGTVALNGATVNGNTPNNCFDVPGC